MRARTQSKPRKAEYIYSQTGVLFHSAPGPLCIRPLESKAKKAHHEEEGAGLPNQSMTFVHPFSQTSQSGRDVNPQKHR